MSIKKCLMVSMLALGLVITPVIMSANAVTAQEVQQFEPDTITVYGKTVTVQPFLMSQTSFTWYDVKDDLPEQIWETPEEPMTYEEVFNAVQEWVKKTQWQYEAEIERLTQLELARRNGEGAAYTDLEHDIIHKEFSDKFHIPGGEEISPATQRANDRNLAAMYLQEMLREAFGYGEPRF